MIPQNADFPQAFIFDTIAALLAQPGAKQRGAEITCCSPFRDERNPSFSFNIEKLCAHDFATGQGYGLIETARALGIELDRYQDGAPPAPRAVRKPAPAARHEAAPAGPPAAAWQRAARRAISEAQRALWSSPDMLRYLRTERLLSDETIRAAGLGYNAAWQDMPDGGKLAPGIILPYEQPDGALWALRVRTFSDKLPKYLNAAGSKVSGTLYGAQRLAPGKPVLLVEGEFDCLLAQQDAGDALAVVTLGPASNHLTPHWRAALMNAPVIYLALDNDPAGQAAAAALAEALAGADVRLLRYPDGIKDYTDYRKAGGLLDMLLSPARAWWTAGMPDVWRAELRRYYGAAAELAADTINRAVCAGLINPDGWTAAELTEAARRLGDTPTRTLTRGIDQLLASDLMSILGIEDTKALSMPKLDIKSVTNRPAHRPAKRYRCNPVSGAITRLLAQAAPVIYQQMHPVEGDTATAAQWTPGTLAALDLSPEAAADVNAALAPVWAAQGGTRHIWAAKRAARALAELRRRLVHDQTVTVPAAGITAAGAVGRAAAQLRAQVEAGAPPRSYAQLAADLGVSRQSIPAVLRRAGVVQVERTATRAVTRADDLPRQAKAFAGAVRGKVLNILVETDAGQVEKIISYAGVASIETVREHLAAGKVVKLEARCASAQQLGALPPAAPKARAPQTIPRRPGQAPKPKPKLSRAPAPAGAPAPTYSPAWIMGQLLLQARLAALLRGGQVIDRGTGELVPLGAPGWRLLAAITGLALHKYRLPAPGG